MSTIDPEPTSCSGIDECRIDSHQHFWLRSRGDYDWLTPELGPIYQDFLVDDLRPILQTMKVSKTVLVQAAETDEETDFLLSIAEQTDFVAGVVGWVDMTSPEASERLKELASNPYFKGVRPMIQDIPYDQWMLKSELHDAFQTIIDLELCFDALVKPKHLPYLKILLERYPNLKVVIDHGAKPDIADGNLEQWQSDMSDIASNSQCLCKLSGLLTEAGKDPSPDQIYPVTEFLLSHFGSERLMWGSDWPVVNLAGDYKSWLSMASDQLSILDEKSQRNIWCNNAITFYNL